MYSRERLIRIIPHVVQLEVGDGELCGILISHSQTPLTRDRFDVGLSASLFFWSDRVL